MEDAIARASTALGVAIDARCMLENIRAASRLEFVNRSIGQRFRWLAVELKQLTRSKA